jgi:WD40 repeat protein
VTWGKGTAPDGRRLATSEPDDAVRLWDANTGLGLGVLSHPGDVYPFFRRLAWSPDGRRLAIGTYRTGVQVFEATGEPTRWGGEYPPLIRHVAWNPAGDQVAGAGDDGVVYVWDAGDGVLFQRLTGHHGVIRALAWNPDGRYLGSVDLCRRQT